MDFMVSLWWSTHSSFQHCNSTHMLCQSVEMICYVYCHWFWQWLQTRGLYLYRCRGFKPRLLHNKWFKLLLLLFLAIISIIIQLQTQENQKKGRKLRANLVLFSLSLKQSEQNCSKKAVVLFFNHWTRKHRVPVSQFFSHSRKPDIITPRW